MNILINYDLSSCTASITGDSTLTEVAFAVESVTSHFLGRGVNRFECIRTRQKNGNCVLSFKSLKKSGPMIFSKVSSIGYAVEENVFPRDISAGENFQLEKGFDKFVPDAQHKHSSMNIVGSKRERGQIVSIVETCFIRPELPFAVLTYGLADMFTGLFALNCSYIKWQGSLNKVQLYIRHNLTDIELKKFLLSNSDYDIQQKASELL